MGSSTIDYVIISEDLFHSFSLINVLSPTELSYHCSIWCGLNADVVCNDFVAGSDVHYQALPDKYIIGDESKQKYVTSLVDEESSNLLMSFLDYVDNNDVCIDELTTQLTGIYQLAASKSCQKLKFKLNKKKRKFKKKWFDGNCCIMKTELRKLGKNYS